MILMLNVNNNKDLTNPSYFVFQLTFYPASRNLLQTKNVIFYRRAAKNTYWNIVSGLDFILSLHAYEFKPLSCICPVKT